MTDQILYTMKISDLLNQIEQTIEKQLQKLAPQKHDAAEYITRKDAAKILKITLPTLHDWTKLGWVKGYKIGSRVLYKRHEVEAAIEGVLNQKHKKGGVK